MTDVIDFNEEHLAFYHQIGLTITQWSHVEFALAGLVGGRLRKTDRKMASEAFLSIENFRAKLQFADTVMTKADLPDDERVNWARTLDRAGSLAKKRNKLAHNWVLNSDLNRAGRRVMLLPTRPAKNANPAQKGQYADAIYLRDVASIRLEFVALMCQIENLDCRLSGSKERFPESQEQPKPPPTLAQIRREIYACASRPPRPSRK